MNLTIVNRIKLCFEILTVTSGHNHPAQEKILSSFMRGYQAGLNDAIISNSDRNKGKNNCDNNDK